jgi:hypothetical protein
VIRANSVAAISSDRKHRLSRGRPSACRWPTRAAAAADDDDELASGLTQGHKSGLHNDSKTSLALGHVRRSERTFVAIAPPC